MHPIGRRIHAMEAAIAPKHSAIALISFREVREGDLIPPDVDIFKTEEEAIAAYDARNDGDLAGRPHIHIGIGDFSRGAMDRPIVGFIIESSPGHPDDAETVIVDDIRRSR